MPFFSRDQRTAIEKLPKDFKLLLASFGLSRGASTLFTIVLLWIVLAETKSSLIMGLVSGVGSLPMLLSFLVGAMIDSSTKKKSIFVLGGIIRVFAALGVLVSIIEGIVQLEIFAFFVSVFMMGFSGDLINSIRMVWTKRLLPDSQMKRGSSAYQIMGTTISAVGEISSGILLEIGFTISLAVIVFLFLGFSIISLAINVVSENPTREPGKVRIKHHFLKELKSIGSNTVFKQTLIIGIFLNLPFNMIFVFLVFLVQVHFALPPLYLGIALLLDSAGSIAGAYLAQRFMKHSFWLVPLSALTGMSLISIGFLPGIYFVLAIMGASGIMFGAVGVIVSTVLLKKVQEGVMAGSMGAFNMLANSTSIYSGFLAGILILFVGVRFGFVIAGTTILIVSLLSLRFKELLNIDL